MRNKLLSLLSILIGSMCFGLEDEFKLKQSGRGEYILTLSNGLNRQVICHIESDLDLEKLGIKVSNILQGIPGSIFDADGYSSNQTTVRRLFNLANSDILLDDNTKSVVANYLGQGRINVHKQVEKALKSGFGDNIIMCPNQNCKKMSNAPKKPNREQNTTYTVLGLIPELPGRNNTTARILDFSDIDMSDTNLS